MLRRRGAQAPRDKDYPLEIAAAVMVASVSVVYL